MNIRVYYEDTDAGGIIYHTNYIKYCERARSELFFEKNLSPSDSDKSGFVVKNLSANFIGTASLGNMLHVKTELLKKKSASLVLKQSIFKEEHKIFEMEITLVFVHNGKPSKIPEYMSEVLS